MARIMVVDDDSHILKYCDSILGSCGHEVVACSEAYQALEMLATHNVSLLIADVVMPKMNGFKLLEAVKRYPHFNAPILMLTGRRSQQDVQTAVELGATDYIIKPLDRDILLAKIDSVLGHDAPVPEVRFAHGSANAQADVVLPIAIQSVTEMGMVVQMPTYVDRNVRLTVNTDLFSDIGIQCPLLRTAACKPVAGDGPLRYEVFVSFIGLDENAMQKIRRWIHSRTSSLRKAG